MGSAIQILGIITVAASFVVGLWAFSEYKLVLWIVVMVGFLLIEIGRRMKGKDVKRNLQDRRRV